MKKKNVNLKLNLSKKTISNLDKSGLTGGTAMDFSANSYCGFPCIVSLECDPTDDCGPATLAGNTCAGLSCEGFTCAGLNCPG